MRNPRILSSCALVLLTVLAGPQSVAFAAGKKKPPPPARVVAGTGDEAAPVWTTNRSLTPPVKLRNYALAEHWQWKRRKCGFRGQVRIWDPVNKELLWVGGNCASMEKGFAGNWKTSDGKTWKKAEWTSALLDPLRERCLAARTPARDGENAARNIHFAGMEAGKESSAVKGRPTQLLAEAVKLAEGAVKAISDAKGEGWEAESVKRGGALAAEALKLLKRAHAGFSAGKVDAKLLADCFNGQWKLDEAASCLAAAPGAIMNVSAVYLPARKSVLVFGGSHGDYVVNDTWIYDCAKRGWRRVWGEVAPGPRYGAKLSLDAGGGGVVVSGGAVPMNRFQAQKAFSKLNGGEFKFDLKAGKWTGTGGKPAGSRAYMTVWKHRDPRWYDSEAEPSAAETKKWHDSLKPNTWTLVPKPKGGRVMSPQSWGTSPYDPERDMVFCWSGGHCADVTDVIFAYHLATNRWSIGYVPGYTYNKGLGFDGRPDCANHTYKHSTWDPVSKKLVMTHGGGTSVYNVERRDYDYNFDHKFNTMIYKTAMAGTPKGVYVWTPGALRLFDEKARKWTGVKVTGGKIPPPITDQYVFQYDSKRNALYMMSGNGWNRPGIYVWKLDLATMAVKKIAAKNAKEVMGTTKSYRESAYVPEADLVVLNNFVGGRQVAFDPEKETWLKTNIRHGGKKMACLGRVGGGGLLYDRKRKFLWLTGMFGRIYVLKLDVKTLRAEQESGKTPPKASGAKTPARASASGKPASQVAAAPKPRPRRRTPEQVCTGWFSAVRNYRSIGKKADARRCLNEIIKAYPGSKWAARARREIRELGG
jgi:hypothetical protein